MTGKKDNHTTRGRLGQFWSAQFKSSTLPLYSGFLYTGAMTVLLGAVLPRIAALHHLQDSQCGTLLMAQFLSSATGALFVRRRFEYTLVCGYALMAVGAIALTIVPDTLAVPVICCFGLGLGMVMTSSSMLLGRIFPDSRGIVLSLSNFSWSIGATACPLLVSRLPDNFSLALLCIPAALLSLIFAMLVLRCNYASLSPPGMLSAAVKKSQASSIILFSGIAFFYVGAESAVGNWMSAYASRAVWWDFGKGNLAAACFWAALLLGRGLAPVVLLHIKEISLQLVSVAGASIGIVMLARAHSPVVLLAGACCTGLALAPIFPLTISLFMASAGETENAGWVFAIAGFGGAVLPWIMGLVSTGTHSLRAGLLVCLGADAAMLLLSLLIVLLRRTFVLKVAAVDA